MAGCLDALFGTSLDDYNEVVHVDLDVRQRRPPYLSRELATGFICLCLHLLALLLSFPVLW